MNEFVFTISATLTDGASVVYDVAAFTEIEAVDEIEAACGPVDDYEVLSVSTAHAYQEAA